MSIRNVMEAFLKAKPSEALEKKVESLNPIKFRMIL